MKKKQEQQFRKIALEVATQILLTTPKVQVEEQDSGEKVAKKEELYKIDEIARNHLFEKVRTSLPCVFNEKEPIAMRSFAQWLALINRSELVNTNLPKEIYSLFDEMNLSDVKTYFSVQLTNYYNKEVTRVVNLHSTILRDYYSKKEKGTK